MGLSEPVQKPAEAEQIDLRTFGRPPIDQVPKKNFQPNQPLSPKGLPRGRAVLAWRGSPGKTAGAGLLPERTAPASCTRSGT